MFTKTDGARWHRGEGMALAATVWYCTAVSLVSIVTPHHRRHLSNDSQSNPFRCEGCSACTSVKPHNPELSGRKRDQGGCAGKFNPGTPD